MYSARRQAQRSLPSEIVQVVEKPNKCSPLALSDKSMILAGAAGRMATRLVLLSGTGLRAMQLMRVAFSLGIVAEVAFYAQVLKVVPLQHVQRLVAITQSCYLVAHSTSCNQLGFMHVFEHLCSNSWLCGCMAECMLVRSIYTGSVQHPDSHASNSSLVRLCTLRADVSKPCSARL